MLQVLVSPGLDNIQRASFTFDFDYERKVVAEEEAGSSAGQNARSSSQRGASSIQVTPLTSHSSACSQHTWLYYCASCLHCPMQCFSFLVLQVEDPWTSEILKFTEMGFSREEVCMGLAALGSSADKDNEVCAAATTPDLPGRQES